MFKYFATDIRKVVKMPVFIGPEIGNQTRDQDTAEQGKKYTKDLRGSKTKHRSKAEIK